MARGSFECAVDQPGGCGSILWVEPSSANRKRRPSAETLEGVPLVTTRGPDDRQKFVPHLRCAPIGKWRLGSRIDMIPPWFIEEACPLPIVINRDELIRSVRSSSRGWWRRAGLSAAGVDWRSWSIESFDRQHCCGCRNVAKIRRGRAVATSSMVRCCPFTDPVSIVRKEYFGFWRCPWHCSREVLTACRNVSKSSILCDESRSRSHRPLSRS